MVTHELSSENQVGVTQEQVVQVRRSSEEAASKRRNRRSWHATVSVITGGTCGKEPACRCRRQESQVWSLGQEDPLEEGTWLKQLHTHKHTENESSRAPQSWVHKTNTRVQDENTRTFLTIILTTFFSQNYPFVHTIYCIQYFRMLIVVHVYNL